MSLAVFVVDPEALYDEEITLDGAEGHHAADVQRLRTGQRMMLTDGCGHGAECEVVDVAKARLTVRVLAREEEPTRRPTLTVVQAIPKGDEAQRAVDALTQAGADIIVPWSAARNVVTWQGARAAKGPQRWQAASTAAAKQSRRLRFPEVTGLHDLPEVATRVSQAAHAFVLDSSAAYSPADVLAEPATAGEIVLVVGPEGGITDQERSRLAAAGATSLRLGPTVLRASLAGAVAAAAIFSRTPRWR